MAIKLGEKILRDMYLGDKRIVKAYFGEKLVFEADKPIFVDYIESTGTQWIDTEYIMTSDNQEVECEFQYTDSTSTQCLCGTLPGANRGITPYTSNDSNFYVHTGQPAVLKFTNFDYSAKHSLYVKAVVGQGVYGKLDNTEQTTTTVLTTINKSNPYFLFCRNNGTTNKPDTSYFKGRIYRFKMKDDGVVVRDLKPCLHPKTFEACMYDTVSHKYFYNKGTGNFIPAPRFVEYLESDGNCWIDMETLLNQNHRVSATARLVDNGKIQILFGNILNNTRAVSISCGNAVANSRFSNAYHSANLFRSSTKPVTYTIDKTGITIDDEFIAWTTTPADFQLTESSFLLGNRAANISYANNRPPAGTRLYGSKTYENDVLIQDLRPCLRGNTPCMFDMVEGKYYMNAGTGTFGYGEIKFVDYIESDGNQYIDTGLIGSFNTKAEVKFTTNSVSVYPGVFGARASATSRAFNIWARMSSGYIGANISSRGGINSGVIPSVGTEYIVSLSNNQLVVNDNTTTFTVADFTTPTTMLLFDINGGGTHTGTGNNRPLNGRVYYSKVWENGELIQHLRPCLDHNNVACMYDMVSGTYFYNQGTGQFIAGGVI